LVSVRDNTGQEIYQMPLWVEQRAEGDVIINEKEEIAFVKIHRHAVVPPKNYVGTWDRWKSGPAGSMLIPHPVDLGAGVTHLELAQGYTDVILREAEEEVGYKVKMIALLQYVSPSTAFFATSLPVYVGKASAIPSGLSPLPEEGIKQVIWVPPEEVRGIETLCSLTLSSLFLFRNWALKQKDDFWREIGEKL